MKVLSLVIPLFYSVMLKNPIVSFPGIDSLSIWIPETRIIVTDSDVTYTIGHRDLFLFNDTIEYKSSTFKIPICGYAAVAMHYDTIGMKEGVELHRTYDEVVRIYKTSRKYTDAEEQEIIRIVTEHMKHKRLWVEYLSPFNGGTSYVRSVWFDIKTSK